MFFGQQKQRPLTEEEEKKSSEGEGGEETGEPFFTVLCGVCILCREFFSFLGNC